MKTVLFLITLTFAVSCFAQNRYIEDFNNANEAFENEVNEGRIVEPMTLVQFDDDVTELLMDEAISADQICRTLLISIVKLYTYKNNLGALQLSKRRKVNKLIKEVRILQDNYNCN